VYCIADSFYGAALIFRGSHSVKWWAACRCQVFDRGGSLQTAIYPVEYIGDNSTAASSSQLNHFSVRRKIWVDTNFSPAFQILQIGFQMLPDPINRVETPTSV